MLSKVLLLSAIALLVAKYLFRVRWRQLGAKLDRGVNFVLVALMVVYTGQLLWWWLAP